MLNGRFITVKYPLIAKRKTKSRQILLTLAKRIWFNKLNLYLHIFLYIEIKIDSLLAIIMEERTKIMSKTPKLSGICRRETAFWETDFMAAFF